MKFKTDREQLDFDELSTKNNKLKELLCSLDNYCIADFDTDITVTSIHRTEEENAACHAETQIHVLWHAADASVRDFTQDQQQKIIGWVNSRHPYPGTPGHKTALIHSVVGGARHLHLQYW